VPGFTVVESMLVLKVILIEISGEVSVAPLIGEDDTKAGTVMC